MSANAWKPARHAPLVTLGDGLWTVNGELELLPIGRRMTVMRASGGELLIHSAVACDEPTMRAIEALGPVGAIIVPSAAHKIDAPRYATRYPAARVLTPAAARRHVEKVVPVHGSYDELSGDPRVRVEMLDGVAGEGVFIHTDLAGNVSLVFNDALMNLPDRLPGFKGWITKVMGSTGGPKVTPTARRFIVRDLRAYQAHLRRLAEIPGLCRIVVSHGDVVLDDAPGVLCRVAATLG
jgi:hypothetical protein